MAVGCEMVLVPARQWVGTVFFVKIVTFICQSCYMYLSKLLSVFAKEVSHVVGCEMVPVPARRWVEAGRAARLARSVGTDLGESREHPQTWYLRPQISDLGESREHPQFWKSFGK